jgi:hypothetical protein
VPVLAVLARAGVTAPAVVVNMAKTDKPIAAVEKPLRITIPPGATSLARSAKGDRRICQESCPKV